MRTFWRRVLKDPAYVGPRTARVLMVLLIIGGAGAAIGGVGYAINGATQAPAKIAVPIRLGLDDVANPGVDELVPVRVNGVELPEETVLQARDGGLELVQWSGPVGRWTGFLARADSALYGLGFGICAVLLVPVLGSVAAGEPFRPGNSARIAWTAAIVALVGMTAPMLPEAASAMVLDGLGLWQSGSPFAIGFTFDFAPIGLSGLIFVIAEAFRGGTRIASDSAGLV